MTKKQQTPDAQSERMVKIEFTEPEIKELGGQLARATTERCELENEKKAVSADFKSRIDRKSAEAESLSTKISNGYEFKSIPCDVFFNEPNTGMKTIIRKDNCEVVEKLSMTAEELQLDLPFGND